MPQAPQEAPDLSVVIPAYDEEDRLPPTLEKVLAFLESRGESFEVLVVDDGSSDDTSGAALAFAERGVRVLALGQNRGKGAAIRHGVLESLGRQVLLTDADLSTPIEDLERLEPRLEAAPVVIGSRAVDDADVAVRQPFYREWMGKVFNRLIRLAGIVGLKDTQCGFKLLRGDVARDLCTRLVTDGFAYDVELVWLAHRLGHEVREVGVRWVNSPTSKVSVWADPPKMLLEIARFRWLHRGL